MLNLAHHYLLKRDLKEKGRSGWIKFLDTLVYVGAFLTPIVTLPQVLKIYSEKNASGVSIWSWVGYCFASVIWLLYGFAHKENPIIFSNFPLFILNIIIVIGIILYA